MRDDRLTKSQSGEGDVVTLCKYIVYLLHPDLAAANVLTAVCATAMAVAAPFSGQLHLLVIISTSLVQFHTNGRRVFQISLSALPKLQPVQWVTRNDSNSNR